VDATQVATGKGLVGFCQSDTLAPLNRRTRKGWSSWKRSLIAKACGQRTNHALHPQFDRAAMTAVKAWVFTPPTQADGEHVAMIITVTVNFSLL